jgi:hypothetical protein
MTQLALGLALIAFAAVVAFYGTQLAREGWTKIFSPPTAGISSVATRPYVVFASAQLVVPSDRDKPIHVTFDLKNNGQSEAVGSFKDFTYYFSTQPEQREFSYQQSKPVTFSLAPAEQWRGYFLPSFVLSTEKLEALNSGSARLFVYAKGEYRDVAGNSYQLPFARMYHPTVAGNLAICPDDIVFKE